MGLGVLLCSDDFAFSLCGWAATSPSLVKLLPAGGGSVCASAVGLHMLDLVLRANTKAAFARSNC